VGYGAATAIVLSAFSYTGGRLGGLARDKDVDEVSRKEEIRKNRRRPLEETINELGEGRGTFEILVGDVEAARRTRDPWVFRYLLTLSPDRYLRPWICSTES
jgi:hypothetical protein